MLDGLLAPLERSNAFVWTALAVAVVLTLQIEPFRSWGGNEIHYFDLGLRSVRPEHFGPNHAAFDHSVARFASFAILGGTVVLFGYDIALIALRFVAIVAYAIAFSYLARCLKLSRAETLIALMLFVLVGQCYFAAEWLFAGVEGKVFAYAAIFASIGLAWRDKDLAAVGVAAVATYLHFLVGGFWAVAVIGLIGLKTGNVLRMGGALLAYTVLCLPILAILLYEWFFAPMPDISDLDFDDQPDLFGVSQSSSCRSFLGQAARMVTRDQLDGSGDLLDGDSGVAGTFLRAPRARTLAARYVYVFDTVIRSVLFRSSYVPPRTTHPVSSQLLDSVAHDNARRALAAPSARGMVLARWQSSRWQSRSDLPCHAQCPLPILYCPPTSSYTNADAK